MYLSAKLLSMKVSKLKKHQVHLVGIPAAWKILDSLLGCCDFLDCPACILQLLDWLMYMTS